MIKIGDWIKFTRPNKGIPYEVVERVSGKTKHRWKLEYEKSISKKTECTVLTFEEVMTYRNKKK